MRRIVASSRGLLMICSPHRTAGTGDGSALTERWCKVTGQGLTPVILDNTCHTDTFMQEIRMARGREADTKHDIHEHSGLSEELVEMTYG